MPWLNASRTACSAAVLAFALAGCGESGERLPVLTALHLARLADRVAAGQDCGAPLVQATISAVNQGVVPGPLQEPLLSDANRIAATCSRAAARALASRLRP
jgi:hypothetical protein